MTKTAIILANPVVAKLHEPDDEAKALASTTLTYEVSTMASGVRSWTGHSSFFDYRKCSFPAGFVRMVKKVLENNGYRVILKTTEAPEPLGPEHPVVDAFPEDPRYDYQPEVMNRLIRLKNMIAQVATGGGKSRIFKLCAERIGRPTLFLTTRKTLMYQMAENYEQSLNKRVGILGDGIWTPNPTGVNFGIVDTLSSRLELKTIEDEVEKEVEKEYETLEKLVRQRLKANKLPEDPSRIRNMPPQIKAAVDKIRDSVYKTHEIDRADMAKKVTDRVAKHNQLRLETLTLLEGIEFLCIEEAHEVSGNGFFHIAQCCKKAHYRLALTATPFMKDNEEANMRLMAATGPIGIKVSEKLLISRGILAKPFFKYIKTLAPQGVSRGTGWQQAYTKGIVQNVDRNKAIVFECKRAQHYGMTAMILVQHSKHGTVLEHLLKREGLKVRFIYGKHEQKERKKALDELGSGVLDVLIGSTILDVGVDVPSVGLVVLAGGGKAEVNLRQRVGRGLRAKKAGPNVAFIVDFQDRFNTHLVNHYRERRRIIEETEGFAENIVDDFDFKNLGFAA